MDDPLIHQEYLVPIFSELFQEDGLTVLGKGLGIDILFSKFVQLYSRKESRKLVFCLNLNGKEQAIVELMTSLGIPPNELPKIINNETNSNERGEMYQEGGCFFITSRILIVDLLDNRVDSSKIAGFLLYQANRISETSIESFIIRVYRERNRLGFIKAFSDEPENMSGGFGKIERILKNLFLTKLYLWPRFRLEIAKFLESHTQPEVIEMILPLTGLMKATQNAILVAMNSCLNELKKSCPTIDTTQFTLENGIFYSFDSQLKNQLDPEWHKIPLRTKQIINDVSIIRKLLDYLVRYDSFSFYYLLLNIRSSSSDQHPSLW